jgi:hypothetical protein
MLKIDKISSIIPYSNEWWESRLGRLTASRISTICMPEGIGTGGMTYIRNKVGEKISRLPSETNITTEATQWGVVNEPIAVKYFQEVYQIPVIVTDKHLIESEYFAVTPDGLIILKDYGENYDCETLESKSFPTFSTHIEHCECNTAKEIKKINPKLFWQVIMQMHVADTLKGNAIFYHPSFPEDSGLRLHRVVFNKMELVPEFKFFKARLDEAQTILDKKYNQFKSKTQWQQLQQN